MMDNPKEEWLKTSRVVRYEDWLEDRITELETKLKASNALARDLWPPPMKEAWLNGHPEHRETIEGLENE